MTTTLHLPGSPDPAELTAGVAALCDALEAIYADGRYPQLTVERPWSHHNPVLSGEFARPAAIRWYLERELLRLAERGARLVVAPSRPRVAFEDPAILNALDEGTWDLRQKKLFLFRPERTDLSLERLTHYTGTPPEQFQRFVLFTNYGMHVDAFRARFPEALGPSGPGVQMPAWHAARGDHSGVSIVNIGVGPSNAKTITDHVAVLRPDAMVMVGHCGGLRNHQEIGDLVLATAYMRGDRILDDVLPTSVPITSNYTLNAILLDALEAEGLPYRLGTVISTANRNWDFGQGRVMEEIVLSRSLAIDMESATVAANGFRYRIPTASLLCVSDKPLHGKPKLSRAAQEFYRDTRDRHLGVALSAFDRVRERFPGGLPGADLRSLDEPLLGGG